MLRSWYQPWHYTHPSWLREDKPLLAAVQCSDELLRRLAYPAWCERFALSLHPENYDGSVWWNVAFAELQAFERANHLVGLVLMFACNRRDSLQLGRSERMRGTENNDLRWVLEHAGLIPDVVLDHAALHGVSEPELYGLVSVRLALAGSAPALFRRIALRFRVEHVVGYVNVATRPIGAADARRIARAITRLWTAAVHRSMAMTGDSAHENAGASLERAGRAIGERFEHAAC